MALVSELFALLEVYGTFPINTDRGKGFGVFFAHCNHIQARYHLQKKVKFPLPTFIYIYIYIPFYFKHMGWVFLWVNHLKISSRTDMLMETQITKTYSTADETLAANIRALPEKSRFPPYSQILLPV